MLKGDELSMELDQVLKTGMQTEATFQVQEQDAASHIGSGSLRVLATPSMIAFIEQSARIFLDNLLPEGQSSVGVQIDIRHLAATPIGGNLRLVCEVVDVAGRKVIFQVHVWDDIELVGEGTHQRIVIDVERFMRRVREKTQRLNLA